MIKVDFISPKSIDGVVNSVNGKYGNVELTAEDLGAATQEYVNEKVLEAQTNGVDLSAYATTEYVAEQIAGIEHPTTDLTGYATEEYVNSAIGNIDIPETDLTGYATEKYVDDAVAAIPEVDLTGFYDKEEIDAMVAGYQTEEQVKALITAELGVIENGTY